MRIIVAVIYVILAPILGGLLAGIDRKITARMQGRVGPPILQPFYDVFKLFQKQVAIVNRAQNFFIGMFLIFMVFTGIIFFSGSDFLLVIFALTLSSIFLVLGAYCTNSPYSSVGADRELVQMMSYEPMVLLACAGVYLVTKSFAVIDVISASKPLVTYLPALFLGFIYILTIKLRKSPFDLSTSHHGHQEIVKGITTEFAGPSLAIVEIAHWYENIILLGFIFMFVVWNSIIGIIVAVVACLLIYFVEILIDNSFARVKWNVMLKSSWLIAFVLAFINILVVSLI